MSLYSLSKDELIKIICTVNYAQQEKQNEELKSKYNYLMEQLEISDINHLTCNICNITEILESAHCYKITICDRCNKAFHLECKPICAFCNLCSTCNPVSYAYEKSDDYYICQIHPEYSNINN